MQCFFCDVGTEFLKLVPLICLTLRRIKYVNVNVNGFRLSADVCQDNNEPSISMTAGFFFLNILTTISQKGHNIMELFNL